MSAVRLARAATGRRAIVKFDGCYHGHADALLAAAGSGVATLGLPDSPGRHARHRRRHARRAVQRPRRGRGDLRRAGRRHRGDPRRAGARQHGCRPARARLPAGSPRRSPQRHGALLVFDEVMTGWRVHPAGAQLLYGVEPDLTILGKVVGGGLPAAAYGGRREPDGADRARGSGLPGGHALRQSARDGRRASRRSTCWPSRRLGPGGALGGRRGRADRAARRGGGRRGDGAARRARCSRRSSPACRPVAQLRRREAVRPRRRTRRSSMRCSTPASTLAPSPFEAAFTSCRAR